MRQNDKNKKTKIKMKTVTFRSKKELLKTGKNKLYLMELQNPNLDNTKDSKF